MRRRSSKKLRPCLEALDERSLLSGGGLTAAQVTTAYGLAGLTFGSRTADGSGQTIAIVDAYSDPNIQSELNVFSAANNLPSTTVTVVGQTGTSALPQVNEGWAQEEALDVEWAHAIAPGANIVLVEANSSSIPDLMAGVKIAVGMPGVSVVSMSWGGSENRSASNYDSLLATAGITFVAASGDNGPSGGAEWPASSPSVVGVGGTTLQVGAGGAYLSETVWRGSSGGYSSLYSEPSYQAKVQSSGSRSTPDVAFDGDTNTGVEVYSISPSSGQGSWLVVGGTSLGAPAWAGIIALADQGRAVNQLGPLSSSQTLNTLYSLPSSAFHLVGGAYNTQTGLGSPAGAALIDGLAATTATSSPTPSTTTPTPTPTTPPNNWPTVPVPVIVQPTPTTTTPVSTTPTPVSTTPVSTPVTTTSGSLTPPPAAPPVTVGVSQKKKAKAHAPKHKATHPTQKPHSTTSHKHHA